jgi:hypothetical protein
VVSAADSSPADQLTIARLEARVAALEGALARRSRELRALQRHLCPADLAVLVRIANGLTPMPSQAFEPELWEETTDLRPADVKGTLSDLWASLEPVQGSLDAD